MTDVDKMTTHLDIAGKRIEVGDFILYAALWDRSATLKYGLVTKLAEREESWVPALRGPGKVPTIRAISVDRGWHHEGRRWSLQKQGKPITLSFTDRMLAVGVADVPAEVRTMLRAALAETT